MHNTPQRSLHLLLACSFVATISTLAQSQPPEPPSPAAESLAASASGDDVAAAEASSLPASIELTEYLVLPVVGEYGRLPLHRDSLEAQLVTGEWTIPSSGDSLRLENGRKVTWQMAETALDGSLDTTALRGGYALATIDSSVDRVMLLEAAGHAAVYVNGQPRTGDPYRLGWLRLPVQLRRGQNTLLFHVASDKLSAKLTTPSGEVILSSQDQTLPTLVRDETNAAWAALPVINVTNAWLENSNIEIRGPGGELLTTPVAPIPPRSVRKVAFEIPPPAEAGSTQIEYQLQLIATSDPGNSPLAELTLTLDVAGPDDIHVRTFRSRIDGSVQAYAVQPAIESVGDAPPGMIVTLHGTDVSCREHVARYSPKSWAHVVAPTGRRKHGFDWEEWGRIDVLEAMDDSQRHYPTDTSRVYLTGHSMGGHGAWHLGVTYPDRFAAVGPSSAWASFWSYGGGMPSYESPNELETLLLRGSMPSDTLRLLTNLGTTGVYILHGADDQQVPVDQARFMRSRLAEFHSNFVYYEQPGVGHWWGNECCDWPRMMEFFRHNTLPPPEARNVISFTTADPGTASRSGWMAIEAQQQRLEPSFVTIGQQPDAGVFIGKTNNVARLSIDVAHLHPTQSISVMLDDQTLPRLAWPIDEKTLWFEQHAGRWSAAGPPAPGHKGPQRSGTFKSVFDRNVILVYGTQGTEEENLWAEAKARYDAETFWYRGGGSLEVTSDERFDPASELDRNVVLYGNADTNSAWSVLLATSPVQVRRSQIRVGARTESGDDLTLLMVRPRVGSKTAMVGVVTGTGPAGMRLTNRLRYFISAVAYPDLLIVGPRGLADGSNDVRAWGYFGPDWRVDTGEIVWSDATP